MCVCLRDLSITQHTFACGCIPAHQAYNNTLTHNPRSGNVVMSLAISGPGASEPEGCCWPLQAFCPPGCSPYLPHNRQSGTWSPARLLPVWGGQAGGREVQRRVKEWEQGL